MMPVYAVKRVTNVVIWCDECLAKNNLTPPKQAVVEPLKDLIFGRAAELTSLDGLINRIRLFCTLYDSKTGRYSFDYAIFIGFGIAVLTLSGVATVLVRGWRSSGHA